MARAVPPPAAVRTSGRDPADPCPCPVQRLEPARRQPGWFRGRGSPGEDEERGKEGRAHAPSRPAGLQAIDRAHRIGQTRQVHVYRFVTENTVDEQIQVPCRAGPRARPWLTGRHDGSRWAQERAERKLYLDAMVVQRGQLSEKNTALSNDDLLALVRFGADRVFKAAGSLTDEDIDVIIGASACDGGRCPWGLDGGKGGLIASFSLPLALRVTGRGQQRTEEMSAKIYGTSQHTLKSFSMEVRDTVALVL